ncbi:hypothetical protein BDV98DRAFT_591908 [Pterulicium gracile]|uniref:Ser-Thr-rich glycosyl-phosphatidyl-inositol-anchored membrane family-domain-containing protein n=1 Tax=Pterulicium gracile TaxID=1884261 RepID=A0A5C3QMG4_9AGAR|nr:hypothetical protein BDV98DRAFT_591908 [Pterula gracilis]
MQFSLAILSLFAGLVSAEIVFNVPSDITTSAPVTITWQSNPEVDPPVFSIYLINEEFNDNFGIANNVDRSLGELTIPLGSVPVRGGYTIRAVALNNVNEVYGESSIFSIAANTESVSSASSTSASSSSSSSASSSASTTASQSSTQSSSSSSSITGPSTKPRPTATPTNEPSATPSDETGAEGAAKSIGASYGTLAVAFVGAAIGSVFAF